MLTRKREHIARVRDSLKRFVAREMPQEKAARWDRENYFPRDVFKKLADMGGGPYCAGRGLSSARGNQRFGGLSADLTESLETAIMFNALNINRAHIVGKLDPAEAASVSPYGNPLIEPDDIASVILFAASDAARALQGNYLLADQGVTTAIRPPGAPA